MTDIAANFFYRNKKLKSLFMRKNGQVQSAAFNVVYKYTCYMVHSTSAQDVGYIECTRTTLRNRMKQNAAIKEHHKDHFLIYHASKYYHQ